MEAMKSMKHWSHAEKLYAARVTVGETVGQCTGPIYDALSQYLFQEPRFLFSMGLGRSRQAVQEGYTPGLLEVHAVLTVVGEEWPRR